MTVFIPNLTGRPPPNEVVRWLLALPTRLGGLGVSMLSSTSDDNFVASMSVTAPLRQLIITRTTSTPMKPLVTKCLPKPTYSRGGASKPSPTQITWEMSSLPPSRGPWTLREREALQAGWLLGLWKNMAFLSFVDALALRYGWSPSKIPSSWAYGAHFTVEHMLSCPRGGFPSIRHNEIRDITATLLTEVCNDVCVEPDLQEVTTEVWANFCWCQGVQPLRSLQPKHHHWENLPKARDGKKEGLHPASLGDWALLFHTACPVCKWALRQGGNTFLQKTSFPPGWQMGPTLQSNDALAEMHHLLRPTPLGHPVHPWCPPLSWPRRLLTSRSGDSGGQTQTRVTVFFCFSVFVYVPLPVF